MKATGKTICNMDLEFKFTVMEINTKECSSREEETDKELTTIPLDKYTKVVGLMEESKVLESVHGLMGKSMKANGKIIRNMDKEYIAGQMEDAMKEIIETIKSMGMELIHGLMEESISDNGKTIRGMEEGLTSSTTSYQRREYGKRIKELNGSKMAKLD